MAELGSGVTYYSPTDAEPIRVKHVHRAHLDGELEPSGAVAALMGRDPKEETL